MLRKPDHFKPVLEKLKLTILMTGSLCWLLQCTLSSLLLVLESLNRSHGPSSPPGDSLFLNSEFYSVFE